jgi:PAS domain S-box-containing protein
MDLARRAALVGCYTYDLAGKKMRFSRLNPATYGLPLNTTELTAQQWYARVHRDDMQKQRAEHIRAFKERRPELTNEFRVVRPGGEVRWIEARSLITYDGGGRAERMMGIYIDVTARKQAEDRQKVLVAELDHRVKNVLATVSAVVDQTLQSSRSMTDFAAALDGRIQSMGRTHELLSASNWRGISVAELVQRELAPYAKDGNTEARGPQIVLRAELGQVMAMVVHELVTNAAKHGALSVRNGRVTVRWQRLSNGHQRHAPLMFHWSEAGGPPVEAPTKTGYGTSIIRDVIPYEFGGTIDLTFAASGVQCRIELPADWLSHEQETIAGPNGTPAER